VLSLAFAVGCLVIDGPTKSAFFEAAAQILPVLLLALALEFRLFTPGKRPGTGDLLDAVFLFLIRRRANGLRSRQLVTGLPARVMEQLSPPRFSRDF
jgi:hypothetical protein